MELNLFQNFPVESYLNLMRQKEKLNDVKNNDNIKNKKKPFNNREDNKKKNEYENLLNFKKYLKEFLDLKGEIQNVFIFYWADGIYNDTKSKLIKLLGKEILEHKATEIIK